MSETAQDKVNRILRDHEGYTGDGKGGDGALPVGDRSTAVKPIIKRDLREALIAPLQDTWDARDVALQAQSDAEDARDLAQQAAGSVQYPVSYGVAQSLTGPQQQQARGNIGLGTAATVDHGTDPGEVPLNSDLGSMATEDAGDYVTKASKASQAQAEGGVTGDVWMDDVRVRQAIEKQVAPIIAAQSYQGVGTYIFAFEHGAAGSGVSSGGTIAGSGLVPAHVNSSTNDTSPNLTGTWRKMGGRNSKREKTLWLRIA